MYKGESTSVNSLFGETTYFPSFRSSSTKQSCQWIERDGDRYMLRAGLKYRKKLSLE